MVESNTLWVTGVFLTLLVAGILAVRLLILAATAIRKKGLQEKIDGRLTLLQPYMLLFFVIFFLACVIFSTYYYRDKFLPDPPVYPATEVVSLFNTTTIITGVTFFITHLLLFYFAFRYRTKPGRKAFFLRRNLKLELSWIIAPALVFIFFFIWGQILWAKIIAEPEGDVLEVEVMAQQFNWWVRYPGKDNKLGDSHFKFIDHQNKMGVDFNDPHSSDDFIPVQMHVPKGRPVKLRLRTKDVIHSFFVPHFKTKMDAVPGMITNLHFTPTATTNEMRRQLNDAEFNYEVACAELCGRMHFAMKLIMVVDEPEDFDKWYNAQESISQTGELKDE